MINFITLFPKFSSFFLLYLISSLGDDVPMLKCPPLMEAAEDSGCKGAAAPPDAPCGPLERMGDEEDALTARDSGEALRWGLQLELRGLLLTG